MDLAGNNVKRSYDIYVKLANILDNSSYWVKRCGTSRRKVFLIHSPHSSILFA
jgi:hypothetical protein